jgi:hypothetical protein
MSEEILRKLALQVRNWGRWGPHDEIGTLRGDRQSDNYAVEVRPSELPPFRSPFHICAIPNMGLTLGEIFNLEALAADCAADGRYAFLLVAPPLPVTNAVGTPINPYAMK